MAMLAINLSNVFQFIRFLVVFPFERELLHFVALLNLVFCYAMHEIAINPAAGRSLSVLAKLPGLHLIMSRCWLDIPFRPASASVELN